MIKPVLSAWLLSGPADTTWRQRPNPTVPATANERGTSAGIESWKTGCQQALLANSTKRLQGLVKEGSGRISVDENIRFILFSNNERMLRMACAGHIGSGTVVHSMDKLLVVADSSGLN